MGTAAIEQAYVNAQVDHNVAYRAGMTRTAYAGFSLPASVAEIGFANAAAGDLSLSASSPYRHAGSDGSDIGVDASRLPPWPNR